MENGKNTLAGIGKWANGMTLIFRDDIPIKIASATVLSDLILPGQRWNISIIHHLYIFTLESVRNIKNLELPIDLAINDTSYWLSTPSRYYSTKSGYSYLVFLYQQEIYNMKTPRYTKFFRIIWGSNIMPKWEIFLC